MKYEEIAMKHQRSFGQHRPMKLNGIVNRKRFVERWKWISTLVQRWRDFLFLTLDKHIQDGYGDQTALFMIPRYTNYKKYTYSEVKQVAKLAGCSH
jgi:hypothetical protein